MIGFTHEFSCTGITTALVPAGIENGVFVIGHADNTFSLIHSSFWDFKELHFIWLVLDVEPQHISVSSATNERLLVSGHLHVFFLSVLDFIEHHVGQVHTVDTNQEDSEVGEGKQN